MEKPNEIAALKAAVASNPIPFLKSQYPNVVEEGDSRFRYGNNGGHCSSIINGELLAHDFTGGDEDGDIFHVLMVRNSFTFPEALDYVRELYSGKYDPSAPIAIRKPVIKPRPDKEALLMSRPEQWPLIGRAEDAYWNASVSALAEDVEAQAEIDRWRGWPSGSAKLLARSRLLGSSPFSLWPHQIRPQPCATFPVLHPALSDCGRYWHSRHVQIHCRFTCPAAARKDGRGASWVYAPTMKQARVKDGGNAPFVIAFNGADPQQPGREQRCDVAFICAGEWDAASLFLASGWVDGQGGLNRIPPNIAIVGIRGEGRGGTDAYLRFYSHWRPRKVILIGDADETGRKWFKSDDGRPSFEQQLTHRGAAVIPQIPGAGAKDLNDMYAQGHLGLPDIEELLKFAGYDRNGGAL